MTLPKLLICGDFAKPTGFARVNEALAQHLRTRWSISVLAVNYKGDYTPLQQHYQLYPARLGGDEMGMGRIAELVQVTEPDAILVVCDPWIAPGYLEALGETHPPIVLYTPVDATHLRKVDIAPLNGYDQVIAYTQFGATELIKAGYRGPMAIAPHGIDLDLFAPLDQADVRARVGMPLDTFAVLVLDRNQPRKRLDIAFDAFAQFANGKPESVKLVYHGALDDVGWDIEGMADDLGIADRLILTGRFTRGQSVPVAALSAIYSMCDVRVATPAGEGWSLPAMEAMACGLPNVVPDFAALGEWAAGAVAYVPAPIPHRHPEINTVGRVPLAGDVAHALDILYERPDYRAQMAAAGLSLVAQPQYRWAAIADSFDALLRGALTRTPAMLEPQAVTV
jgi:D-inositol-3-phosphate glycosyltransferase